MRSSEPSKILHHLSANNSFRIRTYKPGFRKPFRFRTYEKQGGGGTREEKSQCLASARVNNTAVAPDIES